MKAMNYTEEYIRLKSIYTIDYPEIGIPDSDIRIYNFNFLSRGNVILPDELFPDVEERKILTSLPDKDVMENNVFIYPIFASNKRRKNKEAIVLLHGLNERSWDKYLCWAKYLAENTGKSVILFPIAFHINRTPKGWKNLRNSSILAEDRKKKFLENNKLSSVNAVLSERLTNIPQRFLFSGLQTIMDLVDLTTLIKEGHHPLFEKDTKIDFLAYSIGAFIAQILMIANPHNYYDNSKFFFFCGGSVLSRMNGTSKFILDSVAFNKIIEYYNKDQELMRTKLHGICEQLGIPGAASAFNSMIAIERSLGFRESAFKRFNDQIASISLEKDTVMPTSSIKDTLYGINGCGSSHIVELDFPYDYSHETPFPIVGGKPEVSEKVNECFNYVMEKMTDFYSRELKHVAPQLKKALVTATQEIDIA